MHTQMRRQSLDILTIAQDQARELIQLVKVKLSTTQQIDFRFRQAKNLPQFPNRCAVLERIIRAQPRRMWVTLKQIAHNVIAVLPREVNVKIRWILAVQLF